MDQKDTPVKGMEPSRGKEPWTGKDEAMAGLGELGGKGVAAFT